MLDERVKFEVRTQGMKREILFKIIICVLICGGFVVLCTYMPEAMRAVYDSIFQTASFPIFMFVMGLFACEMLFVQKGLVNKKSCYICVGIAFIVSSVMLFNGHSSLDNKLMPNNETIPLGNESSGPELSRGLFMQYYFDNKNLFISKEQYENRERLPYVFRLAVPPGKVIVDEEVGVSEDIGNMILSYPNYFDGDYYFVVDAYWEKTTSIRLIRAGDKFMFCSQDFLDSVQNDIGQIETIYEGEDHEASTVIYKIEQARCANKLKHIVVLVLLLAIGLLITLPIWGEKYPILAFFMSFPVSVAAICVCGVLLMMLNIPYNLWSILGGVMVFGGIWGYRNKTAYKVMNWQLLFNFMLAAVSVIILLVYMEVCFTTYDSMAKCVMAYRLAKFGSLKDILVYAAPYGMLEPMIMSIGYMFHCGLLYAFYPLMAASGIGVMYAGLHYMNIKIESVTAMLVLASGTVLLLSNYDFLLSCFYVMSHGPIAVYMLIFVMLIVLRGRIGLQWTEGGIILAATIIMMTRVEGAVYVLFILVASIGLENESMRMFNVNIIMAVAIIAWNIYQMIYIKREATLLFWTPNRGILLIVASMVVLIFTLCISRQWKFLRYIRNNFYLLFMAFTIGIAILTSAFMKRSLALINLPVYLAHFSNSVENDTNSAALWTFIFLICPLVLCMRSKESQYAITVVLGYIVMTFVIFLFRSGEWGDIPLKLKFSDSARRMIVQIMPVTVWLLAYCVGERERLTNKHS